MSRMTVTGTVGAILTVILMACSKPSSPMGSPGMRFAKLYTHGLEKIELTTFRPCEDSRATERFRYSHCNWGSKVTWASSRQAVNDWIFRNKLSVSSSAWP